MVNISKVQFAWTGGPGGPGVTTMYTQGDEAVLISRMKTFFDSFKAWIPQPIVVSYPTSGVTVDLATGQPNGTWTANPTAVTTMTGSGNYAAAAGAMINWHTGLYVAGRELRGKTFIVPLMPAFFDGGGRLSPANANAIATAAAAVIAPEGGLGAYSRKYGTYAPALSASVPAKSVVLRSRRD